MRCVDPGYTVPELRQLCRAYNEAAEAYENGDPAKLAEAARRAADALERLDDPAGADVALLAAQVAEYDPDESFFLLHSAVGCVLDGEDCD